MPYVVGLTGGIGSGKSAAALEFGRLGATIVDTDVISRDLTGRGGGAISAVRALLGADCIGADGAMNRAKVRERVFRDPALRRELEAILHPMIRAESSRRIAAAGGPYVVHVIPLLLESRDYRERVQRVLVVDCPEDVQIARVRERSGLSEAEVRDIMATQAARAARLAAADDVIDNSGSLDALRDQVGRLHERYLVLARGDSANRPQGAAGTD